MNDNIIKMFIGSEEVVSNKEFTINEEMLSASSTILNNCYPASWEETKDYVSNFYYPKDYSKYILGKGNFKYGTDRYTKLNVSGIFPTFETNIEKPFDGIQIEGKSEQATRSGKNLLPDYFETDRTVNGINYIYNSNGTYNVNGTASGGNGILFLVDSVGRNDKPIMFSAGTYYTLKSSVSLIGYTGSKYINLANNTTNSFTLSETTTFTRIYLQVANGKSVNDVIAYPIISTSPITINDYEKYGVSPSPDYPSEIESVKGKNLYGNITWQVQTYAYFQLPTLNEDYTLSLKLKEGKQIPARLYVMFTEKGIFDTTQKRIDIIANGVQKSAYIVNTKDNVKLNYISVYTPGYKDTLEEYFDIQLEKGTVATDYLPYNTIQIKNTGKNLFDINTATLNSALKWTDGTYYTENLSVASDFIKIEKGKSYISKYKMQIILFNENKEYIGYYNNKTGQYNGFTISTDSECNYVKVSFRSSSNNNVDFTTIGDIQLEKGTVATDYEEYKSVSSLFTLNQPLRSLPNGIKDIAYIKNGILYVDRKVGSVVLNGTESWGIGSTTYNGLHFFTTKRITDFKKGNAEYAIANFYSNYFHSVSSSSSANLGGAYFINSLFLVFMNFTTVQDFRTWLSTHNTQVDYELAEPYTEKIGEVDTLSTFKGINNVSLDANMETNMNLTYLWKNYDVLFAGIVKNSGDISLRPTDPKYCSLQILDYKTFLSESDTLDFVISDKTISEAISMVVDAISGYGFILGTINISQADDVIGTYSTLNKTAYDVFQYLANISGSRWRARFVDNDTMAIDFYDPELLPRANDIDYTQQYWEDNKIVDLTFNYGTRDYRNKQIILSDEVYGGIDYTEVLLSNGYGTSYITQNNIANITSITVNGVKAEVITQSEKDLGVDADFYYTPGKNVVESTTSYSAGTQIIITYTPLVKGRQIVYNDEEVTRIATQTNTTGVISRYENRNDILSSDELENIAETYIKYKGKPEIILKLTTLNNDLFNIGEICYFNSPIADLEQDYMVKSKATNYTSVAGETNIFYTYELTSSFNSEKAINYFDNQRNKTTGNIAEGESITRNIDINNSAMIIWENATITEISVSVDGDNALNSVLNSPFIQ